MTNNDVRMRGFTHRSTVEAAWEWIDAHSSPLDAEERELESAFGRVLATDVTAQVNVPGFDRSAMDGYALRGEETTGAGDYNRLTFRLLGESLPGSPFPGTVATGTAVRIMTGAPLPDGADAVLPAEYAREIVDTVEITNTVPPAKNVGWRGEDIQAGDLLLSAGRRLRPQDLGVIASVGKNRVKLVRRPRVRILITGNELVAPGQPHGAHQIYDSNSSVLQALTTRDSGIVQECLPVEDDRKPIRESLLKTGADVILVSGGSSVGAEDHAPGLLAEVGELALHGIAMRPSSPTGMGCIEQTLVFLLPGNPVSCLCAYDFFAGRAIRRMAGRSSEWPYRKQELTVDRKIVSDVGRVDYCRVRVVEDRVLPLAISGASVLSSTTSAHGFVIVPAACEGYGPGSRVTVYLYDSHC